MRGLGLIAISGLLIDAPDAPPYSNEILTASATAFALAYTCLRYVADDLAKQCA